METKKAKEPDRFETVDSILDKLGESISVKMLLFATMAMANCMVGCFCAYMVAFTGFVPEGEWSCVQNSSKCNDLREKFASDGKVFYSVRTICDNNLIQHNDYVWHMDRTNDLAENSEGYGWHLGRSSIAVDFDKVCDEDSIRLLSSLYFVGGVFGLCFGTMFFELMGRRKASMVGAVVCVIGTVMGVFCNSYAFYMGIRLLQGFGQFLTYSGSYIWVLEFVPEKYRAYYNAWSMLIWSIGYPGLVAISYFIKSWNYIHLAAAIIFVVCYSPLFVFPDSPRYLMSVGRTEEAKAVLVKCSKLATKPINLTDVTLVNMNTTKATDKQLSFLEQLKEFVYEKAMFIETLVQYWMWLVCCLLYYGLNYGWGAFGDSPYTNYLFAGLGEVIAYVALPPISKVLGRRRGMIFLLTGAFVCFLLGMIPWVWSHVWNFERLMSITAVIMISDAFGLMFLYTGELAPTTHRGLVFATCGLLARVAAFMGPFVSSISSNSRVKLGINALLAGSAVVLTFLLPETQRIKIPEVASDVTTRRIRQNMGNLKAVANLKTHDSTIHCEPDRTLA